MCFIVRAALRLILYHERVSRDAIVRRSSRAYASLSEGENKLLLVVRVQQHWSKGGVGRVFVWFACRCQTKARVIVDRLEICGH